MPALVFKSGLARELDMEQRHAAKRVLDARFPTSLEVISAVLGFSKKALHCHRAGCAIAPCELAKFSCIVGTVGGECVAAACLRHLPPTSRREGWTELLLLAVREDSERRGYGTAMVQQVKRLCTDTASAALVVVSNGSQFWRRPRFWFCELAGPSPCQPSPSRGVT